MTSFDLRPHACAFFSSTEEENREIAQFLREGIQRGSRVIYTVPPDGRADVEKRLGTAGVDIARGLETGSFLVQDWNVSHCPDGHFDPVRTVSFFENQVHGTIKLGYPRVRFASHMEWALEYTQGADSLLEYEARANKAWKQNRKIRLEVLCVYDASRFDAAFLINVMRTHPFTMVDGVILENPYYTPPAEFLKELRARRADPAVGGLAPWQLRRINALLTAIGQGLPSVSRLAEECGAFTRSTGLPPHRWLLKHRVELAKQLLLNPGRSLAEVALASGFTSQSHFTRIFSAQAGCSPGAWRRRHG